MPSANNTKSIITTLTSNYKKFTGVQQNACSTHAHRTFSDTNTHSVRLQNVYYHVLNNLHRGLGECNVQCTCTVVHVDYMMMMVMMMMMMMRHSSSSLNVIETGTKWKGIRSFVPVSSSRLILVILSIGANTIAVQSAKISLVAHTLLSCNQC